MEGDARAGDGSREEEVVALAGALGRRGGGSIVSTGDSDVGEILGFVFSFVSKAAIFMDAFVALKLISLFCNTGEGKTVKVRMGNL